ncbi:hypothetical protein, partial [Rhodococcus rhodochrous]|uniref:hypothetical protein n=1 Tax=Rhodococcus rhodochrous TaxID=1829 RepID=UPI0032DFD074
MKDRPLVTTTVVPVPDPDPRRSSHHRDSLYPQGSGPYRLPVSTWRNRPVEFVSRRYKVPELAHLDQ